jgi:dolichol-phosphate mannosyltransferase
MVATTTPRTRPASERTSSESPAAMPGPHMTVSTSPTASPEPATGPPRLLVTLATFNEVENVRPLVESIRTHAPGASVLIIDDNSPDGTGKLADDLAASTPDVHVIHRAGKLGLGTAIIEGMEFAISHGFDYVLNLDADFSHPPRFIPAILAGMDGHDVMIGSRYVPGGGFEGHQFNLKRKFMSTGINVYARLFLGLPSKDNSGSFRCYRVSKLAAIDLRKRVRSRGYSFMEEILFWCRQVGCTIGETPIIFENRRAGVSKINKYEAYMALRIIFELGVGRVLGTTKVK